jgi:hypothetical protein
MMPADFTTTIVVDQEPIEVYNAINNVRGWWSEEIEGNTDRLNEEFSYHFEDIHRCRIKPVELIPGERVVWQVMDNYFKFTEDKTEWIGTRPSFEISRVGHKTQVKFTHIGLVPEYECFNICRDAWTSYIQNSLQSLISTGVGKPNAAGKPMTEDEKKLIAAHDK